MPKVSVILTSYQKPVMVIDCINSVLSQTFQDFELLIADDNSSEDVVNSIYKFLPNPKIRFYRSMVTEEERPKQVRYAFLINELTNIAKGEILVYIADDDLMLPHKLQTIATFFDANPQANAVYGKQHLYDYEHGTGRMLDRGIRNFPGTIPSGYGLVDHSSACVRRKTALEVGGWPTSPNFWMNADAGFFDKLAKAGNKFYGIDMELDHHRFHGKSCQATGVPNSKTRFDLVEFFDKFNENEKPFIAEYETHYTQAQKELYCYIRTFHFNVFYVITDNVEYQAVIQKAIQTNGNKPQVFTATSFTGLALKPCDFVFLEISKDSITKITPMLDKSVWYFLLSSNELSHILY